jgi:hypothetical protein
LAKKFNRNNWEALDRTGKHPNAPKEQVGDVSFPIYWPNKESGRFFLQGRTCVGYEHLDTKIVDPDNHSWPTSPVDPLSDTLTPGELLPSGA